MKKHISLQNHVLNQILSQNENPQGYKICIKQLMKGIQDRTYWYFTVQQAQFLQNVYKKQVQQQSLRNRLKQITDDSMNQIIEQIITGKLTKIAVQQKDSIATIKVLQKIQHITSSGQPNIYSNDNPIAIQTQQKIKQINQEYKKFKQRIQMIKKKQIQKKLQKQSIQRQIKQKIKQQKKLEYHKQVMKRLEIIKLKQEERIQQNQKYKNFIKSYKKIKPLHVLMEQQYKQKVQLPQLEESRKKLDFKNKKKPTLQEINQHQRAYIFRRQNVQEKSYVQHHTIDAGYKSHFYKKIEEEQKEKEQDQSYSILWDQVQKKKRYSLMVKEKFIPKTSRKLHQSIQVSRAATSAKKIIPPDNSRVKQLGNFYLQYVRSLQKNRNQQNQNKQQPQNIIVPNSSRYTNYLEDFKKSNQNKLKGFGTDWQIDLNDRSASRSQKRDRILMKSKQLEEKAMREQLFIKNQNYQKAQQIIDKKKQIDQTLLEAIKAKMALLKQVKSI